jgi:hypothetical protein
MMSDVEGAWASVLVRRVVAFFPIRHTAVPPEYVRQVLRVHFWTQIFSVVPVSAAAPVLLRARLGAVALFTAQCALARRVVGVAVHEAAERRHALDGVGVSLPGSSPDARAGGALVGSKRLAEDTSQGHVADGAPTSLSTPFLLLQISHAAGRCDTRSYRRQVQVKTIASGYVYVALQLFGS